jgi:hypothetical protein
MNHPTSPKPPLPPKQPTTKEMPGCPPWVADLKVAVDDLRASNATELRALGDRVESLEKRQEDSEQRAKSHSDRAREAAARDSQADMKQDQTIAAVVTDVATLKTDVAGLKRSQAAQTEMLTAIHEAVIGVVTNPKARFVGRFVFILAAGYAAAKGIKVLP